MVTIHPSSTISFLLLLLFSTLGLAWTTSLHPANEVSEKRDVQRKLENQPNFNLGQSNDRGHIESPVDQPRTKLSLTTTPVSSSRSTAKANSSRLLTWDDHISSKVPRLLFDSSVRERSINENTPVNMNRTSESTTALPNRSSNEMNDSIDILSRSRRQIECRRDRQCGFNSVCFRGRCRRDREAPCFGRRCDGGGGVDEGLGGGAVTPAPNAQTQCQRRIDCPRRQVCIGGRCFGDSPLGSTPPNEPANGGLGSTQPGTTNTGGNGGNGMVIINVLGGNGGQAGSTFAIPRPSSPAQ